MTNDQAPIANEISMTKNAETIAGPAHDRFVIGA
jgi:hypothetical protein